MYESTCIGRQLWERHASVDIYGSIQLACYVRVLRTVYCLNVNGLGWLFQEEKEVGALMFKVVDDFVLLTERLGKLQKCSEVVSAVGGGGGCGGGGACVGACACVCTCICVWIWL